MMRILVITGEAFRPSEAEEIRLLLDEGAERIHLRKPQAAEESMRRLIESLPQRLYPRLTLHDHLPLAVEYGLGGVHLNSRSRRVPDGFRGVVSCSCHTLEELALHPEADYCFLSPIFDSISKSGYRAAFNVNGNNYTLYLSDEYADVCCEETPGTDCSLIGMEPCR